MGKMLNQHDETNNKKSTNRKQEQNMNAQNSQQINKHSNENIINQLSSIIYLTSQPKPNFLSTSLQLFNLYKKFVQNTIIQLGQDWRIQSGLLAQEIINEKNLNNDQFCIFSQFMAGFLRAKIIQQEQVPKQSSIKQNVNGEKIINKSQKQYKTVQSKQQQQQYEFLKYFCHTFPSNSTQNHLLSNHIMFNQSNKNNNRIQTQNEFSNNLTFKTLSLGFYITAGDIWMRMFKKYHKVEVEEAMKRIQINDEIKKRDQQNKCNGNNIIYFATLSTQYNHSLHNNNHLIPQWVIQPQQQVYQLLTPYQSQFLNENKNNSQNLHKCIKLGSVIVNIKQTQIKTNNNNFNNHQSLNQHNNQLIKTIRQISLCRQFYTQLFLVWLIFSIKKSFNSTLFTIPSFIRYCDIIIGSRIFTQQKQKQLVNFHSIYRQFKLLCDSQWKKLMKDYMIALNDDKEVLGVLVKRIQEQLVARFNRQIDGKKMEITKLNNNKNKN